MACDQACQAQLFVISMAVEGVGPGKQGMKQFFYGRMERHHMAGWDGIKLLEHVTSEGQDRSPKLILTAGCTLLCTVCPILGTQ